jgi:predicted metalloprotease with PDZ domain
MIVALTCPRAVLFVLLCAAATTAAAASRPAYEYEVRPREGGRVLEVDAVYRAPRGECLEVDTGFLVHLEAAEHRQGHRWRALERRDECLAIPVGARELQVRYRFRLDEATAAAPGARRRRELGQAEGVFFARPSVWMLRPATPSPGTFRLHFVSAPDAGLATGIATVAEDVYEAPAALVDSTPYSVIGTFARSRLNVPGGVVEWVVAPNDGRLARDEVERWLKRGVEAVSGYFGRFPVPRVLVIVSPGLREGVSGGTTWGYAGASILIGVGATTPRPSFDEDWVLTHELVHLGFPNLAREHRWMEEGLATYVEPIARVRAGQLAVDDMWRDLLRSMPRGLPQPGAPGLDEMQAMGRREAWGRTYWGGALFWLLADIRLREATNGRVGVDGVLTAILDAGGDIRERWEIARVLSTGDRLAGRPVLEPLYDELAVHGGTADLPALWARLGVTLADGAAVYDAEAPLVQVREAITRANAASGR